MSRKGMRTVGISHKTRYWQHYCFSNPPEGYRYVRVPDIPWHRAGIHWEFLTNTKFFLSVPRPELYHTYNGIVVNGHPWVIEVESYIPRFRTITPGSHLHRWALRRLAGKHCKALIFTSQASLALNRERLLEAGVPSERMKVIYRAVEPHEPQGRHPDRFTILFAGNGFYRKGGVEMLKAFLALNRPEARLEIISRLEVDWGLSPLPEIQRWVEKTVLEDPRITWYRDLPHDGVIEHMRAADLFIGPTFLDPFNNTVLEAMASGLPVISSDAGALPEVVEHGRNGWMIKVSDRSGDEIVEQLKEMIGKLMNDTQMRNAMGRAGLEIVKEKFSLGVRNAALLELYNDALAST